MWLINTASLKLEEFHDIEDRKYAILSHTWEDEEISFQEIRGDLGHYNALADRKGLSADQLRAKKGYRKILSCCRRARHDGYEYAWIDTCCIDKSSSAELSEAINSMYNWYRRSDVCYVYLSDAFSSSPDWFKAGEKRVDAAIRNLRDSRWFTRGWTLQELLAPTNVEFLDANWVTIGAIDRRSLSAEDLDFVEAISRITGIASLALQGEPPESFNIAQRMSWAADRQTSRIEDRAYSLLGLFDVNMPLLYGEGKRAFKRLQEHIIENNEDYTLFAWQKVKEGDLPRLSGSWHDPPTPLDSMLYFPERWSFLADDPSRFAKTKHATWDYSQLQRTSEYRFGTAWSGLGPDQRDQPPSVTSRGIRMTLPIYSSHHGETRRESALLTELKSTDQLRVEGNPWLAIPLQTLFLHSSKARMFRCTPLLEVVHVRDQATDVKVETRYAARTDEGVWSTSVVSK